jgi:hypothetical protein
MPLLVMLLIAGVYDETPLTVNPDLDYVQGTYSGYRAEQPEFTPLRVVPVTGEARGTDFLIVMEEFMSDSLDSGLVNQWVADIQSEGNTVAVVEITYADPVDIRSWLAGLYANGLKGVVFVGDIPAPWSCIVSATDEKSQETFPSDYFYMDLDGEWKDDWIGYPGTGTAGQDSIYDGWSGDLFPEIYTGRITTSVILLGNEYDLIEAYLTRLHEWRLNGDPSPKALCYVDDDWSGWGNSYRNAMLQLYSDVELVSQVDSTNGTDYRQNRLQEGYTWISPFVHSNPVGHHWSPGPVTTSGHIWADKPPTRFYNLFSCSNCRFTTNWCMGCVYTFGAGKGLASVGSTKSGAMLKFTQFYTPLGNGNSLGAAYKAWWSYIVSGGFSQGEKYWHLGMVLLGDPTIMPAMHFLGIEDNSPAHVPSILFSANPAVGAVTISTTGSFTVFDMTGREVAAGQNSEIVTGLKTGVYMVTAGTSDTAATEKLCIIR